MKNINENYEIPPNTIAELALEFTENLCAAMELGKEFMFQTVMEYGNFLGDFPNENMTEDNKIHGCQSTVYISAEKIEDRVFYKGFADSKLVAGEVAILLKIFDGQTIKDIIENSKQYLDKFVSETNLIESLTPSRQNAFGSMYEHIKKLAGSS